MVGCLVGWLVSGSVGWLVDWLVAWLVGGYLVLGVSKDRGSGFGGPKWLPDGFKMAQNSPKTTQNGSKTTSRRPRTAPGRPQDARRRPQEVVLCSAGCPITCLFCVGSSHTEQASNQTTCITQHNSPGGHQPPHTEQASNRTTCTPTTQHNSPGGNQPPPHRTGK